MRKVARPLGLFSLVMLHMTAVGGVKSWPAFAQYGAGSLFLYLGALLLFLVPLTRISIELNASHPGGIYVWVEKAFGPYTGRIASWLLWVQNILWIPTILLFITTTTSYIFLPHLAENPLFCTLMALVILWALTIINMCATRFSAIISSIGALLGIFLPACFVIFLGVISDKASLTIQTPAEIPWPLFFIIIISLMGLEMPGAYASDVRTPAKTYPKALWIALPFLAILPLLGILTIQLCVPLEDLLRIHGSIQAFAYLIEKNGLTPLVPLMAFGLVVGALGVLNTWIGGPSRLVQIRAPLLLQGLFISFVTLGNLYLPHIISLLPLLAAQLYLCMYLILFTAAMRLRSQVLYGSFCIAGILSTLTALSFGFITQNLLLPFIVVGGAICLISTRSFKRSI